MTAQLEVRCPNPSCGKVGRVPCDYQGGFVRCSSCKKKFRISAPRTAVTDCPVEAETVESGSKKVVGQECASSLAPGTGPVSGSVPERIGRFEIRALVGSGAFGCVYRAFDRQLDREVALKVARPGMLDSPRRAERFLREAKSAAQLHHPRIVPIHETGQDGAFHYIVSAFIAGHTLEETHEDNPLTFHQAAETVKSLAEALAYAHRIGIVHRDVKPANVLLDQEGQPFLADFGLAQRQDQAEKLTQDGSVLGTPAYMSPEQASGHSAEVLPTSDQYSLGALFYELLCGQTPFTGPPQTVLFNAVHTQPPPPRSLRPDVPLDLETVCLKALAKHPEDRYADCQELADDLRRWLEGEPIRARRLGWGERAVRWCRREPTLVGAVALMLLSLLGVAVVASVSWASVSAAKTEVEGAQAKEVSLRRQAEDAKNDAETLAEQSDRQLREILLLGTDVKEKEKVMKGLQDYLREMAEGDRAMEKREFDKAIEFYQRAGGRMPPESIAALAAARRVKEAEEKVGLVRKPPPQVQRNPNLLRAEKLAGEAKQAFDKKDFEGAEKRQLESIDLRLGDPSATKLLLAIQKAKRKGEDAVADAKRQAKRVDDFNAAMADGRQKQTKGSFDGALKAFGAARQLAPDETRRKDVEDEWDQTRDQEREAAKSSFVKDAKEADEKSLRTLMDCADRNGRASVWLTIGRPGDAVVHLEAIEKVKADSVTNPTALRLLTTMQLETRKAFADAKKKRDACTKVYKEGMQKAALALSDRRPNYAVAFWARCEAVKAAPTYASYLKAREERDRVFELYVKAMTRPLRP
jgi:tRNA A-37 threonylcarbamoyl transferase component Bud32